MAILKKPLITAKSSILNKTNKFCFIVDKKSNKPEIKKMVKKLYGISVEKINTMVYAGKSINRRTSKRIIKGTKPSYKKVILTLPPGSSMNMQQNIL